MADTIDRAIIDLAVYGHSMTAIANRLNIAEEQVDRVLADAGLPRRRLSVEQRTVRRQKRLDKRRREELPLFATDEALLDSVQPLPRTEEIEQFLVHNEVSARARNLRVLKMGLDSWIEYRLIAERYITIDQVAVIESECRRIYPPCETNPSYRADHWQHILRALQLLPGAAQLGRTHRMWRLEVDKERMRMAVGS